MARDGGAGEKAPGEVIISCLKSRDAVLSLGECGAVNLMVNTSFTRWEDLSQEG